MLCADSRSGMQPESRNVNRSGRRNFDSRHFFSHPTMIVKELSSTGESITEYKICSIVDLLKKYDILYESLLLTVLDSRRSGIRKWLIISSEESHSKKLSASSNNTHGTMPSDRLPGIKNMTTHKVENISEHRERNLRYNIFHLAKKVHKS